MQFSWLECAICSRVDGLGPCRARLRLLPLQAFGSSVRAHSFILGIARATGFFSPGLSFSVRCTCWPPFSDAVGLLLRTRSSKLFCLNQFLQQNEQQEQQADGDLRPPGTQGAFKRHRRLDDAED